MRGRNVAICLKQPIAEIQQWVKPNDLKQVDVQAGKLEMRSLVFALVIVGSLQSSAATAKPTYLSCITTQSPDHKIHQQIFVNEEQGSATVTTVETGNVDKGTAVFMADRIDITLPGPLGIHFVIDRANLKSSMVLGAGLEIPGQCEITRSKPSNKI